MPTPMENPVDDDSGPSGELVAMGLNGWRGVDIVGGRGEGLLRGVCGGRSAGHYHPLV